MTKTTMTLHDSLSNQGGDAYLVVNKFLDSNCPKYQSHKIVKAAIISDIEYLNIHPMMHTSSSMHGQSRITLKNEDEPSHSCILYLDTEIIHALKMKVDGYFVLYEDGYISYSPYDPFIKGYRMINEKHEDLHEKSILAYVDKTQEVNANVNRQEEVEMSLRMKALDMALSIHLSKQSEIVMEDVLECAGKMVGFVYNK